MLGNTITLPYDSGVGHETVYTQVSSGEFSNIRKDIAGTRSSVYSVRTLKLSQQYNADGKRRALIRLDCTPVATDEIPKPQSAAAYIVVELNDNEAATKAMVTELLYELGDLLGSVTIGAIVNGEF